MRTKLISIVFALLCLVSFVSCSNTNEPIKDNYEFSFDEKAQSEYIDKIEKTKTNTFISYTIKDDTKISYIVYTFKDDFCNTKVIYTFYTDIDNFRMGIKQHENYLDGFYSEVNEKILLVKTMYSSLEQINYNQLYETINSKYEIR